MYIHYIYWCTYMTYVLYLYFWLLISVWDVCVRLRMCVYACIVNMSKIVETLLEYSTLGQVFLVIAAVVCHWDDHVSRATCRLAIDIDHYRSKMIHLRFHLCIPLCLSVSEESSNPVFIWFFLALLSSCACSAFRFRWHDEVVFVSALDWVRGLCQFSDFTNGTEQICACVCVACAACAAFWHNSHFEVYFGLSRHLSWNISLHFEVALHVITCY
jgi:hypothetical protein